MEIGVSSRKSGPKEGTHAERIRRERGGTRRKGVKGGAGIEEDEVFGEDFLTPDEMRDWAHREIKAAARAFDMRARQLMDLVAHYSAGKISAEKADELQSRYDHRWGDALPTPLGDPPRTDEDIL